MKFPDGLAPTGRKLVGPAADLVEVESENGLAHTAIVFHNEHRGHPSLTESMKVVTGFLESPMVVGLVELSHHDLDEGTFVYPTGQAWCLAETCRILGDIGEPGGVRAGLELMYAAGGILIEAAEIGASEGVYSHGGLTPWRVMLKRDGQVLVVGHALPQVEILEFLAEEKRAPREDSFRYCPPERLQGEQEDLTSDLFALSLIAFEVMTGKPVYDGLVKDIRQHAARGEASRRLFRFREVLPESVRELLGRAMHPDIEARFGSGDEFLDAVRDVLSSKDATGPSLMDLMDTVAGHLNRSGKEIERGETAALDPEDLKRLLGEDAAGAAQGRSAVWDKAEPRKAKRRKPPRKRKEAADSGDASVQTSKEESPAAPAPAVSGSTAQLVSSKAPEVPAPEPAPPSPSSDGGEEARWGKGRSSRRSPRRTRTDDKNSDDRAKDLIDEIKAKSSGDSKQRTPENGKGRSASDVIASILRSSDKSKVAEGAVDEEVAAEEASAEAAQTDEAPRPEEAPLAETATKTNQEPAVVFEEDDEDEATAPLLANLPKDEEADAEEHTLTPIPAVLQPLVPEQARSISGTESFQAAADLSRTPDPLDSSSKKKGTIFKVKRGPDVPAVRIRLPTEATSGEAVAWLVGKAVPVRTDLQGKLSGWYRLEQGGEPIASSTRMADIDPDTPIVLRFVQSHVVHADISVVGGPVPLRFVSPVGTAVPVASLVDHLAAWLDLEAGRWHLYLNGKRLDPHDILQDRKLRGLVQLQLKRSENQGQ